MQASLEIQGWVLPFPTPTGHSVKSTTMAMPYLFDEIKWGIQAFKIGMAELIQCEQSPPAHICAIDEHTRALSVSFQYVCPMAAMDAYLFG